MPSTSRRRARPNLTGARGGAWWGRPLRAGGPWRLVGDLAVGWAIAWWSSPWGGRHFPSPWWASPVVGIRFACGWAASLRLGKKKTFVGWGDHCQKKKKKKKKKWRWVSEKKKLLVLLVRAAAEQWNAKLLPGVSLAGKYPGIEGCNPGHCRAGRRGAGDGGPRSLLRRADPNRRENLLEICRPGGFARGGARTDSSKIKLNQVRCT